MSDIDVELPRRQSSSLFPKVPRRSISPAPSGKRLAKDALAAQVNGHLSDLTTPLTRRRGRGHRPRRRANSGARSSVTRAPTCWPSGHPPLARGALRHRPRRSPTVFYYDFELPGGGPLQRRRFDPHRGPRCAPSSPRTQPFTRDEYSIEGRFDPLQGPALQGRDHQRRGIGPDRRGPRRAWAAPRRSRPYSNSPAFRDLCRGPHVPSTSRLGALQVDPCRRRVLARRREEPATAAHLRHGLGERRGASRPYLEPVGPGRTFAITASWVKSSTSSPSRVRSAQVWRSFTPKGGTMRRVMEEYSRKRHEASGYRLRPTRPTSPSPTSSRSRDTSNGSPNRCIHRWSSTRHQSTT